MSREWARRDRLANPERSREARRRWRAADPDRARAVQQDWRSRDPERAREYARQAREKRWALLARIKLEAGCVDCGFNTHAEALDFDHREPSTKDRTMDITGGVYALDRVMAEIAKCDVRCANCHRIKTRKERKMSDERALQIGEPEEEVIIELPASVPIGVPDAWPVPAPASPLPEPEKVPA